MIICVLFFYSATERILWYINNLGVRACVKQDGRYDQTTIICRRPFLYIFCIFIFFVELNYVITVTAFLAQTARNQSWEFSVAAPSAVDYHVEDVHGRYRCANTDG